MSTADEQPQYRRRHNFRGPITLLILLGLLAYAAWYGANNILGQPAANPVPVCHKHKATGKNARKVTSKQVTVNVYNAGDVRGLAQRTADALTARGFNVETVTNAPKGIKLPKGAKAMVRAKAKTPQAELVAKQAGKATIKTQPKRKNDTIDLIVGNKFNQLAPKAPKSIRVVGTVTICITPTPTSR
jgi:hypothetical protein